MLPSIGLVMSVEMIRDGGSLAAVFQGSNGSEYWLFFPLRHRTLPSGVFERLGYAEPVVIERQTNTEIKISWQRAIVFIQQIRPLIRESGHEKWLEVMEEVAKAKGALPGEVERVL